MNAVERIEGEVAALSLRLRRVEQDLGKVAASGADARMAVAVVEEMGFRIAILRLPGARAERQALARRLAGQGWSQARIARALGCCERTIERWLARTG